MRIRIPHNFTPRDYQLPLCRALDNGYRRGVAVWHRRSGKDKTLINIVAKEAFKRIGSYYYFYPFNRQGRMALWNGMDRAGFPFMAHFPKEIISRKQEQEMRVELVNGASVQIVGTDDIDRVVGTNPVGCVFSEYALQKPEAWDFIRPILRENDGWALFNYTPRGLNHGWKLYDDARKNPEWFSEILTIRDTKREDGTPVITEEDIEKERREGMSEALIRQEYYCDFAASSDDVLIPMDIVMAASGKQVHQRDYDFAPRVIGVDVARFGDDCSVVIRRQGLMSNKLRRFANTDNMTLASYVAQEIREWNPDAVFIDSGRGEGVIDRLRQLGYSVIEINFGGRARNQRYYNRAAEMWDGMKQWLISGGSIPDDVDLRTELSLRTYSYDPKERLRLVSKDKMKDLNQKSPDAADALALTFAEPVSRKDDTLHFQWNQTAIMDSGIGEIIADL